VTYELPRATAKLLLEDHLLLQLKGARAVPAMKDGKPDGFKLYAIRPSSAFAKLGFTNGDTVISVAGHRVELGEFDIVVKKLKASLVDLKSPLARVDVAIVRRGKPVTLTFKVK
jgi:general secretion pathway protein C